MYREDFSSQQLLMNNDPEDVTVDLYPDQDPDLVVENRAEQPNLASESNDVLISQVSQAPDGFLSPEKEGEVKTPTKNSSGSSIFFGMIHLFCMFVYMYVCAKTFQNFLLNKVPKEIIRNLRNRYLY